MTKIGTIKMFSDRGFGFLTCDNGDDDVFVHANAFRDAGLAEPLPGSRYSFEIAPGRGDRTQAVNLQPA